MFVKFLNGNYKQVVEENILNSKEIMEVFIRDYYYNQCILIYGFRGVNIGIGCREEMKVQY